MNKTTYPYSGEKCRPCKACGRTIYFYAHPSGKMIPVNFKTKETHFADCPAANKFRKPKGDGNQQGKLI